MPIRRRKRREAAAIETDYPGRSGQAVRGSAYRRDGPAKVRAHDAEEPGDSAGDAKADPILPWCCRPRWFPASRFPAAWWTTRITFGCGPSLSSTDVESAAGSRRQGGQAERLANRSGGLAAAARGRSVHLHGAQRSIEHRGQALSPKGSRHRLSPSPSRFPNLCRRAANRSRDTWLRRSALLEMYVPSAASSTATLLRRWRHSTISRRRSWPRPPTWRSSACPTIVLYGVKQLLFNEGNELLAFPVVVAQMEIVADGTTLDEFQTRHQAGRPQTDLCRGHRSAEPSG